MEEFQSKEPTNRTMTGTIINKKKNMHQSEDMHTLHGATRSMEHDETRRILTPPGTWTELPYLEHQHQSEVLVAPVVVLKKKLK